MKKIILGLITLLSLSSCNDFLKPDSPSEYTPESSDALKELLLGEAYPTYKSGVILDCFLGLFEDDVESAPFADKGLINSDYEPAIKACYSWQPDMFKSFISAGLPASSYNTWYGCYKQIKGANAVLDDLPFVSGSTDDISQVKAEALTLRAFYYFHLVNIYGAPYNYDKDALGVPLKLTAVVDPLPKPRNTVDEVYTQVLNDLNEAEQLYLSIPEAEQWKPNFRTSLPAVQLLLSRVYLYQENWTKSAEYAEKVLANSNFSLLDINSLPAAGTPNYNFLSYINNSEIIWLFGNCRDTYYFSWEQSLVRSEYFYYGTSQLWTRSMFKASDSLLSLYDDNDLRPNNYIMNNPPNLNDEPTYKVAKAKVMVGTNISSVSTAFSSSFRLSEAYLNAAESYAKLGNESIALELINKLRMKRFKTGTYTGEVSLGEDIVTEVRNERRRELCFEGHRWFDLRREGMPSFTRFWPLDEVNTISYTLIKNDPAYTTPIPEEALNANTSLIQNPLAGPR